MDFPVVARSILELSLRFHPNHAAAGRSARILYVGTTGDAGRIEMLRCAQHDIERRGVLGYQMLQDVGVISDEALARIVTWRGIGARVRAFD